MLREAWSEIRSHVFVPFRFCGVRTSAIGTRTLPSGRPTNNSVCPTYCSAAFCEEKRFDDEVERAWCWPCFVC